MKENYKILIVDDEIKIVKVVKLYLEKMGYKVITSMNGKEAIEIFEREKPSLVILDLMLPDVSGEEICKYIRNTSRVPIMMLTAKIDETHILNGFDIGADDYILKPFSPRELVARVQAVLRRTKVTPLANIQSYFNDDLIIDFNRYEVYKNQKKVNLTPIEFKILSLLATHPHRVFTRDNIIEKVYQDKFEGYDRSIDSHIKNLRKKMMDSPPKYIKTVHGVGYRFGVEDNE